jgi:hypothetical protein
VHVSHRSPRIWPHRCPPDLWVRVGGRTDDHSGSQAHFGE